MVLAVLVTLLIWFGVIIYWQETVRLVTAEDIGIYLIGLPLVVVGLGFAGRAIYRRSRKPAPSADAAVAATPPVGDDRERGFTLAVLAVGLASSAGNGAGDTFQRFKARDLRPCPDSELRSRDGFPVFACRIESLDVQTAEAMAKPLSADPPVRVLRGLALFDQAVSPALETLTELAPPAEGSRPSEDKKPVPLKLGVSLITPETWDEAWRTLAARHLAARLEDAGWPAESVSITALGGNEGTACLRLLDAFCLEAGRSEHADYKLVIACESSLDEDVVAEIEEQGALFSQNKPDGIVPGEAAAALLLQRPLPPAAGSIPPMALLHRGVFSTRDKPVDAAGRISHALLVDTAQGCIAASQVKVGDIAYVVSDIDHRGSRSGECASAITDVLPEVDPVKSFFGAGQSLGTLQASGALFSLGLAVGLIQEEQKPILLLAAAHPTERAAFVLKPYVEPAATAGATA